ncbi:MAG: flagellar hook capping protein [Eubacterium sp.]|nr:flagellar hook capping protein [Eubacterium sp.]
MALWQKVENGAVVDTSASATSASKEKANNNLDKEDFLNLLVAQMKYQDPLQPQSNTEYVSQLATFTQVEATENMAHTAESLEAGGLIGKTVIMRPTNSVTGETSDVVGVVDYMMKEGSNIYLAINGSLYNLDDLYTVADSEYMDAVVIADDFESTIAQMPDADHVSLADEETFKQIRKQYDNLTDYQKEFIANNSKDSLDKFLAAETALNALIALRDMIANGGNTSGENENGENDATEENGTEATTPTE